MAPLTPSNGAFLGLAALVGAFGSACLAGIPMAIYLVVTGGDPSDPGPGLMGVVLWTQMLLFAGWSFAVARTQSTNDLDAAAMLGIRRCSAAWVVVGFLTGCAGWTLSSWLTEALANILPGAETMGQVPELLSEASGSSYLLIASAVVLGAPLGEELIFRGLVYRAAITTHAALAIALSTITFALFHMAPIHVVALLPMALMLSLLRWSSRSVWPSIACHGGLNLSAALLVAAEFEGGLPAPLALGSTVAAFLLWGLAHQMLDRGEPEQ